MIDTKLILKKLQTLFTEAELEDMHRFNDKYEAFLNGERNTELLEEMFSDYLNESDDETVDTNMVAIQTAAKIMRNEGTWSNKNPNHGAKKEAQWPKRFKDKAAVYYGPFKEPHNQAEFMSCVPVLEECKTTHTNSVSVSEHKLSIQNNL